ncbi:cytochrome-c peroxidase [Plastorhodobacter daqingensis]|uniref:Cytochrome-c peroxidase n=1 Tax=Plastorhodobacter daqingensis TaxID=1387281 RepID=A0ABW2UHS9_9RHOB
MHKRPWNRLTPAIAALMVLSAPALAQDDDAFYRDMFEPLPALPPIPADNSMTREKIELGKMLFFEPRISSSGVISCATCHNPALGWTDRIPRAVGHLGQEGSRNTPTVLNAGFLEAQFWDGREATLEGQALGPIAADVEMAMDLDQAVARLQEFETYREHFAAAFPDDAEPINADNVAQAIASFERTLNTPNSPFDRYLRGDEGALTEDQIAGMRLFVDVGCASCHNGPVLSDSNYHVFDAPGSEDEGRFVVTGDEADRFAFRTPTLRNVAVTYPYFNNGSVEDLHQAVYMMGDQMLGYEFTDGELDQVVAFLHALTGEMPAITPPALP